MTLEPPTLATPRLVLRTLEDRDLDALLAMHAKPAVMRYWTTAPWSTRDEAVRFLARSREPSDSGFRLGIVRSADDTLIGHTSLFAYLPQCRRAELGYLLDDGAWHQGYAGEAVGALLRWGFEVLDLNRVQADIDPRNTASARLLQRLGFRLEGTLRDHWIVEGEVSDTGLYALLRREWAPAAGPGEGAGR